MTIPVDGLYYRHSCSACGVVEYDCLPMRRCQNCLSRDVVVTFDQEKRLRELGQLRKSHELEKEIEKMEADLFDPEKDGKITPEAADQEAKSQQTTAASRPVEAPQQRVPTRASATTIVTADGVKSTISQPKKVVFNKTNQSVDWAAWTWNPVTGCNHGCTFCYAREIANSDRMKAYYPNKFEPTFHEYRLAAPSNTTCPANGPERSKRVFVCSMADLFGKWVPIAWVRKVFDACLASPEWEYIFLTKWPKRYANLPLIENAWYGASIVHQLDVARVERAMQQFAGASNIVRWISMEPMLEPITFNDLSWCDLVVIGAQTSTKQPEGSSPAFSPQFDWVVDVVNQCREAGVPYFLKANLGPEKPGMVLPKMAPRRSIQPLP